MRPARVRAIVAWIAERDRRRDGARPPLRPGSRAGACGRRDGDVVLHDRLRPLLSSRSPWCVLGATPIRNRLVGEAGCTRATLGSADITVAAGCGRRSSTPVPACTVIGWLIVAADGGSAGATGAGAGCGACATAPMGFAVGSVGAAWALMIPHRRSKTVKRMSDLINWLQRPETD